MMFWKMMKSCLYKRFMKNVISNKKNKLPVTKFTITIFEIKSYRDIDFI